MQYPATRYIRMTTVDGAQVPGYAPSASYDTLDAYASFLFETEEAAEADLKGDIEARQTEVAAHPEAFDQGDDEAESDDDYFGDDCVMECLVHENGDIEAFGSVLITRERIFAVYGVSDPASAPKP